MPLTPEEEKRLREEIRRKLEERERRMKQSQEKAEEERQRHLEERLRARIREEEEERFFTERGYVKYINRYGEVEWLTPEEAEKRRGRKRTRRTSSRRKMRRRRKLLTWGINVGMVLFALMVAAALYRYNPRHPSSYGSLVVKSTLPGAVIYLDGKELQKFTPDTLGRIAAGDHFLTVYRDGFATFPPVIRVSVQPKKIQEVSFELKNVARMGRVVVETNQGPVQVYVDGLPYQLQDGSLVVPVGYHVITPVKKGFLADPPYRRILVEEKVARVVSFQMIPSENIAYLRISSNRVKANVFLDDRFSGMKASGQLIPVEAGTYQIRVKEAGFKSDPSFEIVGLEPGQTQEVVFYLSPETPGDTLHLFTENPGANIILDGELLPYVTPLPDLLVTRDVHFLNFMREEQLYQPDHDMLLDMANLRDKTIELDF
ncbi:MAG: PEGA domain-containing protein [Calditrichaeota bacterium]|nr:MAG: PEGA domain-containing protein [Calditrichota bacterium]